MNERDEIAGKVKEIALKINHEMIVAEIGGKLLYRNTPLSPYIRIACPEWRVVDLVEAFESLGVDIVANGKFIQASPKKTSETTSGK